MERDGEEEIERFHIPITAEPLRQFLSEEAGEAVLLFIFPSMDRFPERSFIISQSPCYCKISSPGQTSAAGVAFDLPREKRNATYRAERRLNPPDLRETPPAYPLLSFF
jgi:hypothetical protein